MLFAYKVYVSDNEAVLLLHILFLANRRNCFMRVFVSYSHVDKTIVEDWIVRKLRAGGHDVWFDDRLVAGQDWKQQLRALLTS